MTGGRGIDCHVAIAGGGLAGLACALSLGQAGIRVTLCERGERLGGKAGAVPREDRSGAFPAPVEHGPHFVAAWYRNLRILMRHAGVDERLLAFDGFHYLLPSTEARTPGASVPLAADWRTLARLRGASADGTRLWPLALQSAALTLDLLNQTDGERLDELSVAELLHSRRYADETLAAFVHGQILRASSIGADRVSARTMHRLLRQWFRSPRPLVSVFQDDLGSALIDPLTRAVARVAEIRPATAVAGLRVEPTAHGAALLLEDGTELVGDLLVAAVPHDIVHGWLGPHPASLDPRLAGLSHLQSAPMAAMQLAFRRRLRGLPAGVVYLWGSQPPVNAIDLTQVWRSLREDAERTILGVVLSDCEQLQGLDAEQQVDVVLHELSRCLPDASRATLEAAAVNSNSDAPLFVNVVRSWKHRPDPETAYGPPGGARSLYVTGDFARTPVDLACMEGAVLSGLLTARAIAARVGIPAGIEPASPSIDGAARNAAYRLARAGLITALALRSLRGA
jgi:carotenoid phi-ring synthase / carotenoid chi-ring synthase